jgi:hypothetical protein
MTRTKTKTKTGFKCGRCKGDCEHDDGHGKFTPCAPCGGTGVVKIKVRQRYSPYFGGRPHYDIFDPAFPSDKTTALADPAYGGPQVVDIITKIVRREPLLSIQTAD